MWGVRANDFIRDFKALGDSKITLNINSPGGEVFDGLAIYNVLSRHSRPITARIDGIAASVASVIAMAADTIQMPENALMMIHDPSGLVLGTSEDMRELADVLDKVKGSLISAYRNKSGLEEDEIADMMRAETWLTAKEAKAKGFADQVTKARKLAACVNLDKYARDVPPALAARAAGGVSRQSLVKDQKMSDEITAGATSASTDNTPSPDELRASAQKQAREEMQAYTAEVAQLCALAGMSNKVVEFIAKGLPLADIRAALLEAQRQQREAYEVTGTHDGSTRQPQPENHDWARIFAREARHRFKQQPARGN